MAEAQFATLMIFITALFILNTMTFDRIEKKLDRLLKEPTDAD